ncbi:MAG: hypothetical protein HYY00_04490 [Chloroflexi bacterium]|nr:hypothetical protein [Chloroflexota bacterium]
MARLDVLNPVAQTVEHKVDPAPRLTTLAGKRVGLWWNMKAGGDVALDRVAELISQKFPGASFKHYQGSVGASLRHATAKDADRVAAECDVVVGSTSD